MKANNALKYATEISVSIPEVRWDDIGGLATIKQQLQEAVIWFYKQPEAFTRMGITPPRGVLLYGPPGTGKSMLAQAVANESEANFLSIKLTDVIKSYVGESEKRIAEVSTIIYTFCLLSKIFKKASSCSPSILFFDDIDALFSERDNVGAGEKHVRKNSQNSHL
jgi:transitional endoplasmic reticulum ATPase